jgi:hypothetical protein
MSETFLIKKTAFDDAGLIADREANSFVIGPGELNGPAGITRASDLRLYGFGSLKWGEGVDQNLFRLLENFACARKETGDILIAGSPTVLYDETINPVMPKDENDLGIGNGITTPVLGQPWYDTTSNTLFSFNGTHWVTEGVDPGTIRIDAKNTMSVNELECNGQAVSRTRFAALFLEIDTTFGVGDGSTTFNVPTITAPGANLIYIIRT